MCKSLEEGGRRCAAHTRPVYDTAVKAVVQAGDRVSVDAWEALETAATDYAATPEGETTLQAHAESAKRNGKFEAEALLRAALVKGRLRRQACEQVEQQIAEAAARATKEKITKASAAAGRTHSGGPLRDSYTDRAAAAEAAHREFENLKAEADRLTAEANGAFPDGQCTNCKHTLHQGGNCTGKDGAGCGCVRSRRATHAQQAAAAKHQEAREAWSAWETKMAEANEVRAGDRFVVARGRKIPQKTEGTVLRVVAGNYGPRALFERADTGEILWVTLANLDRDTSRPAAQPIHAYVAAKEPNPRTPAPAPAAARPQRPRERRITPAGQPVRVQV